MIWTAQFHHLNVSSSFERDNVCFPEVIHNIPLPETFGSEGCALPVRKIFKHYYKQKKILFDCFIQEETTGRKMTPKDVRNMIREKLEPHKHVEECPICALFS